MLVILRLHSISVFKCFFWCCPIDIYCKNMTMKTIFGIVWDFYDTRAKLIPLKQSQGLNQYFCITIMDFLCLYYDRIVESGQESVGWGGIGKGPSET